MDMTTTINKEITVTALYFRGKQQFKSFPKRILFDNQEITFIESGMQYLVQQGQHLVRLFDMSDGNNTYRLKFDPEQWIWTLVRIQAMARA